MVEKMNPTQRPKLWQFFDSPRKWIKYSLASDKPAPRDHVAKIKDAVSYTHKGAISFCIIGACLKLGIAWKEVGSKLGLAEPQMVDWNNSPKTTFRKFRATLKKFDV